jgi:hypothetical protein
LACFLNKPKTTTIRNSEKHVKPLFRKLPGWDEVKVQIKGVFGSLSQAVETGKNKRDVIRGST